MSAYRIQLKLSADWANNLCVCNDNIFAYSDKTVVIRDLKQKKIIRRLQFEGRSSALSICPTGKFILTGTETVVCLWDICMGSKLHQLNNTIASIIVHSPNGQYIAITSGIDKTIKLWDNQLRKIINTYNLPDCDMFSDLKFSPQSLSIAVGSKGRFYICGINNQSITKYQDRIHEDNDITLAYSPDGLQIASINRENLQIWDIQGTQQMLILRYSQDTSLICNRYEKEVGIYYFQDFGGQSQDISGHIYYSKNGQDLIVGISNQWGDGDEYINWGISLSCLICSPNYRYLITNESDFVIRIFHYKDLLNYHIYAYKQYFMLFKTVPIKQLSLKQTATKELSDKC